MAYIYKIVNDINNKVYIGKTCISLKIRFQEHCRDCKRRRKEQRPLYFAMNKYGVEHFRIELIEQTENPVEREIYWIKQYNSYHNGYNATLGGEGKSYINYHKILKLYDTTQLSQQEIAVQCKCHKDSVKNIVAIYRENPNWQQRYIQAHSINRPVLHPPMPVMCIETQQIFSSCNSAGKWLVDIGAIKNVAYGRNRISAMLTGKVRQNKVGGYTWKQV